MDASSVWYGISVLGDPHLWSFVAVVGLVSYYLLREKFPKKMEGFRGFLKIFIPALFFTLVMVQAMKVGLGVERPCVACAAGGADGICNPYCPSDPSFPSGHAAAVFAFFTSAALRVRRRWFYPLFVAPAVIAYARYALGVHTLADIIVGSLIGILITLLAWEQLKNRPKKGSFWHKIGI